MQVSHFRHGLSVHQDAVEGEDDRKWFARTGTLIRKINTERAGVAVVEDCVVYNPLRAYSGLLLGRGD